MTDVLVQCQGEGHRVVVDGGDVRVVDHDVKAEMAQSLLAGRLSCECLAAALYLESGSYPGKDRGSTWIMRNFARYMALFREDEGVWRRGYDAVSDRRGVGAGRRLRIAGMP